MTAYNGGMKRLIDPRRIEAIDPEVAAILRVMKPHERIALTADAHDTARQLLQAQIARMNPDWEPQQVQNEVARRLAGETDGPPSTRPGRS